MDNAALFTLALEQTRRLHEAFPEAVVLSSIEAQLEYLVQLQSGATTDRSRLKDIVLGVQAAREVEPLDDEVAELLHQVSARVRTMRAAES